jgi:hypothetical protein
VGEAKRKRQAKAKMAECHVEQAPVLQGHLRITVLDDDDIGCSLYFPAGKVADWLAAADRIVRNGRPLAEISADPARWAGLRDGAFGKAREPSQGESAGHLMLWCVMNGPTGPEIRRQVSSVLAEHGHAVIVARRDRKTQYVGTTVGEDDALIPAEVVREAAKHLPDGAMVFVGGNEPRREDA